MCRLPAGADGGCQGFQNREGVLPVDAGVGDGLAVVEFGEVWN